MASITRQPFAELGDSRLQLLQSAKNRQNAISSSFDTPMKSVPTQSTGKRQRAPEIFEDVDSENIDPSVFASPTKKSKTSSTLDFDFVKPAKFSLVPSPVKSVSLNATPSISTRKILTPSSTRSTPINKSRGSPKNNRISAITKRRASSSPFRRVDPPSFNQSTPSSVPFSIDAALSGTITGYTPKPTVASTPVTATPAPVASSLDESMPKGWFFEIHEDTPEQEAANLMEHSASVLDISSDDDVATKQRNEEQERGKENIPPPDFLLSQPRVRSAVDAGLDEVEAKIEEPVKRPRLRKLVQDAMDEDRRPLGDLVPSEFYAEGCDASSYVTVDAGIEKPSSLSKEFDFSCPSPEREVENEENVAVAAEEVVVEAAVVEVPVVEAAAVEVPVVEAPVVEAVVQTCS